MKAFFFSSPQPPPEGEIASQPQVIPLWRGLGGGTGPQNTYLKKYPPMVARIFQKHLALLATLLLGALQLQAQEKVFLHTAKPVYLSGETIWFKAYCLDASSHQLSLVSKVLYVELLNDKAESLVREKIWLQEGMGSGSIFINGELQTGTYYLKAYTAWMRNFGPTFYFEQALKVIHPFKAAGPQLQTAFRPETLLPSDESGSWSLTPEQQIGLAVSKDRFERREKIPVQVSAPQGQRAHLSVSAYRYEPILQSERLTLVDYLRQSPDLVSSHDGDQLPYPPELLTHLLKGKIEDLPQTPVFVLFPGQSPNMFAVQLNAEDAFNLEMSPDQKSGPVLFWSPDRKLEPDQVSLSASFEPQHQILHPQNPWNVDSLWLPFLEELSLSSQIGNAYLDYSRFRGISAEEDTLPRPFYGFPDTDYFLDEYTRFPTMDEVFLEYVRKVTRRRRNKKQVLLVNDLYANENTISSSIAFNDPALVMIDGVPIEELSFLWDFDPLLVEKIDIVQRTIYIGDQSFPGLVNLSTYRYDFGGRPFQIIW
jgi:hypothetical protein